MKTLLKTTLILSILLSQLFAIQEDKIKETMSLRINNVTTILATNVSIQEKSSKIFELMDEFFDYKLMARITMSRAWKKLTPTQKEDFSKAFELKLKNSYLDKLSLYTDQEIKINELKKTKAKRIVLHTQVIGKDEIYKIDYKFHKNKKNNWLIYDVNMIGVSIIQTYKKQFSGFLKTKSFDELLKSL